MKTKILSLFSLTILALIMFAGITSAATISEWNLTVDGSAINVNTDVTAGTFSSSGVTDFDFHSTNGAFAEDWPTISSVDIAKYFKVTIAPKTDYTLTISDINFDYSASISTGTPSFELQYSKQSSFSNPTSLVIKEDVTSTSFLNSANTVNIVVNSGETLTLRWFGYDFNGVTNEFHIKDLVILGTVISDAEEPSDITECSTTGDASGDLDIKIKDINIMSGFGDNEDFWYPLDEIEVEIEVENNGDEDMDDIEVKWGLYNVDKDDWVIDDEESDFNLKDGQDETMYINFELEDVDDFEDDDEYVFYVWANGEIDDDDDTPVCASDSQNIEITNDDDFVVLDNINFPTTASCGSEVQITADVWNVGDSDQDEVKVVIFNSELGINEVVEIGDINDFDNEVLDTFVEIPSDVEEKTYAISLKVFDEDNDVYKTDEDNDESEYIIRITLDSCFVSSTALVSANLESGGEAGENLIVKSTIINSGTSSATYTINAASYAEWANSVSIDQTTFTLAVGASKEVLLTFDVKEDVSGEKQFNIEVLSGNEIVATQPVQVEIEGTSSWFAGITGNALEDSNKYLWGIGILNVVLIIFIIIVAVRVARK